MWEVQCSKIHQNLISNRWIVHIIWKVHVLTTFATYRLERPIQCVDRLELVLPDVLGTFNIIHSTEEQLISMENAFQIDSR